MIHVSIRYKTDEGKAVKLEGTISDYPRINEEFHMIVLKHSDKISFQRLFIRQEHRNQKLFKELEKRMINNQMTKSEILIKKSKGIVCSQPVPKLWSQTPSPLGEGKGWGRLLT